MQAPGGGAGHAPQARPASSNTSSQAASLARSNMSAAIRARVVKIATWLGIIHVFVEVAIQIPILIVSWDSDFSQPLRTWILVRACAQVVGVSFDLAVFFSPALQDSSEGREPREHQISSKLKHSFKFCRRCLAYFYLAWLATGLVWVVRENNRNLLYSLCIVLIAVTLVLLALPAILLLSVCLCMPLVIVLLSRFSEHVPQPGQQANRNQIDLLPSLKYEVGMMAPDDALCVMCLEEYSDGQTLRKLPCTHFFHQIWAYLYVQACIDRWLLIRSKCPLCNRDIVGGEIEV